jgi:sterol desaturase/sphingolipid hydroxylase (fatty acid hydroxylase superfamily)
LIKYSLNDFLRELVLTGEKLVYSVLDLVKHSITNVFNLDNVLIFTPVLILIALLIEASFVGLNSSTLRNLRKINSVDWFLYFIHQFNLVTILNFIITGGILYFIFSGFKDLTLLLNPSQIQLDSVILYFLIIDFLKYWLHRGFHYFPSLWHLHHVHHSASDLNVLNAFRFHPLESAVTRLIIVIPVSSVFFPVSASLSVGVFIYLSAVIILNGLQHSKIKSDFGWLGKVIVAPKTHLIHHSMDPKHFNKNFGSILVIWDKAFGTYHSPSAEELTNINVGLEDHDPRVPVFSYILLSYKSSLQHLMKLASKLIR